MKEKSIVLSGYALLILIGGIIGYITAHSFASIIASSIFALILFVCSALIWKQNRIAYQIATISVACLTIFFTYRFFLSYKLAPGGIMALISGILWIYLFTQSKKLFSRFPID